MKPESSYASRGMRNSNEHRLNNLMFKAHHTSSQNKLKKNAKLPISFKIQDQIKQSGKYNEAYRSLFTDPMTYPDHVGGRPIDHS